MTLSQLNNQLTECGCCALPMPAEPTMKCQQRSFNYGNQGFAKADPESQTWSYWLKYGGRTKITGSKTFNRPTSTPPSPFDGHIIQIINVDIDWWQGAEVQRTYYDSLAQPVEGEPCPPRYPAEPEIYKCLGTGGYTSKIYISYAQGTSPDFTYHNELNTTISLSHVNVTGQQTDEYVAWETQYPDREAWQTLRDEWQARSDAYNEWQQDPQGPEPPQPGDEPQNPPQETYGECTYRATQTVTYHANAFQEAGSEPTETWITNDPTTWPGFDPLPPGSKINGAEYDNSYTYAGWKSDVEGAIATSEATQYDKEECVTTGCTSFLRITPNPTGDDYNSDGAYLTYEKTNFRYKMGVPLLYQQHRLWRDRHATWTTANPQTRGPEPVEPRKFHYYALQWDVVRFPNEWDRWAVRYRQWKAAVAAKAAWDKCQLLTPGQCGSQPQIPPNPTPDLPSERPVFIATNEFWEWTGGETEATQYEPAWHNVTDPTENSNVRLVNKQAKCFRSPNLSVPAEPFGEIYNPADYPA